MVALALRLLVRLHRVAVEHAAAPRALLEAGALHALPVVELYAAVGEDDAEHGLERPARAQGALEPVEGPHRRPGRPAALQQVEVEPRGEQALLRALPRLQDRLEEADALGQL